MLQKNHHIIAIDQVSAKAPFKRNGRPDNPLELELKTDSTLSGNGTIGNELGVKNGLYLPTEVFKAYSGDPVMYISGSGNIEATSARDDDNKLYYQLHVQAAPSATPVIIQGQSGIRAYEDPKDSGKWFVGLENEYYTKHWVTSADDSLAGKSLVLKDNQWVPANEASGDIITTNTFNSYSSFVNNNFVTNSSFNSYSSYVDNSIHNLTNIASSYSSYSSYYYDSYNTVNNYSSYWNNVYSSVSSYSSYWNNVYSSIYEYSSYWNNVYSSVYEYSSYWNNHSALSATKLDKADSGLFMQVAKLQGTPDEKLSGYGGSAFYVPDIPDIPEYSGKDGIKVDGYWIGISAKYLSASENFLSANALDNLSGNWDSVYDTVNDASARWDAHSALSAEVEKKLDASESAKFMKVAGLEYNEDKISGYAGSAFYVPTVHDYKGGNGIEITDEYIINISADYLSANALDNLSGNWNSVYDTVETYSASWNEASAFSANSGKFVTSAGMTFAENLAYVLAKQDNGVVWSGLDVSELGKKYIVTSTNETIYVGSAIDGNTITYNLSANIPEIPGISGENGLSGYFDTEANKYVVGVDERGLTYYKGNVGIDADDTLTNGILPFDTNGGQAENITVENGVFTLPDNVAKVTFSINEVIEDNITYTDNNVNHDFNLNKIALYCNDSEVISTQEYYHNELGLSELSLTYTIDNSTQGSNVYSIRYEGIPLTGNGTLTCKLSIIEEVLSLSQGGGSTGIEYHDKANNLVHVDNTNHEIYMDDLSGVSPIYVDNKKNIGLNYDELQFNLSGGKLQIDIHTSGGNIDQEAFEKLANIVYGRMTETIPFGALNNEATLPGATQYAYLFRPPMEYDMTSATQAYMFGGNGDGSIAVAIYEGKPSNSKLIWQSNYTQLPGQGGGEVVMNYLNEAPTGTITPNNLYYIAVRIHKRDGGAGSWSYVLGTQLHEYRTSVGPLNPWCGIGGISTLNFPSTYSFSNDSMDRFGTHKPYVGFRTKDKE